MTTDADDATSTPIPRTITAMRKTELSPEVLAQFARERAEDERRQALRPQVDLEGRQALFRLYKVAQGNSGQCKYIAAFLLGLYNGDRFPFDLTNFRAIDGALFDDCLAVLKMDSQPRLEVHRYFEDGNKKFEQLAEDWGIEDLFKLRDLARRAENSGSFS